MTFSTNVAVITSDEQTIEQPAFQGLCQLGPVLDGFVLRRGVPWMRPQAMVDVPDAIHVEGIEQDFFLRH